MHDGPSLPGASYQIGNLRYHHFYLTVNPVKTLPAYFIQYFSDRIQNGREVRGPLVFNLDEIFDDLSQSSLLYSSLLRSSYEKTINS